MSVGQIINQIYALPNASLELLKECISEVSFIKGTILLRAEKVETDFYFIKKGIVRAYSDTENGEITFWFGREGEAIISMNSYIENKKAYETIELLENCDLYKININELQSLYLKDIHIANFGRKLAEKELVKTEERLISRQFKSAAERYNELLKENPELIQRVQLGHIASYLGITQVSLSRIRAELK